MRITEMDALLSFEKEIYPRIWHTAYDASVEARKHGLPRNCNLQGSQFYTPSGKILKVYLSAWEQGWDNRKTPEQLCRVEQALREMPVRPMTEGDLRLTTCMVGKNSIMNRGRYGGSGSRTSYGAGGLDIGGRMYERRQGRFVSVVVSTQYN